MVVHKVISAGCCDGLQLMVGEPATEVAAGSREGVVELIVGIVHLIDTEHGLEVAAYDSRKGVVETPELIELDFRFLLLLSERRSLCLSSAKIGALNVEIWQ